jgi:hypothetical protein
MAAHALGSRFEVFCRAWSRFTSAFASSAIPSQKWMNSATRSRFSTAPSRYAVNARFDLRGQPFLFG